MSNRIYRRKWGLQYAGMSPLIYKFLKDPGDDTRGNIKSRHFRAFLRWVRHAPMWSKSFLLDEEELVPSYRYCTIHLIPLDGSIYDDKPTCPEHHQVKVWLIVQGGKVLASASDKQTTWIVPPVALSDYAHEEKAPLHELSHRQKKPACG